MSAELVGESFTHWKGSLLGPEGTPYAGGRFVVDIQVRTHGHKTESSAARTTRAFVGHSHRPMHGRIVSPFPSLLVSLIAVRFPPTTRSSLRRCASTPRSGTRTCRRRTEPSASISSRTNGESMHAVQCSAVQRDRNSVAVGRRTSGVSPRSPPSPAVAAAHCSLCCVSLVSQESRPHPPHG